MANNHLTPEELMDQYPTVANIGWNAPKIGLFYTSGLLLGKYCTTERKNVLEEESFLLLVDYANSLLISQLVEDPCKIIEVPRYCSPKTLMSDHPSAAKLRWSPGKLGVFYSANLLLGYHDTDAGKSLIEVQSFLRLIEYANDLLRSRLIHLRR